MLTWKDFWEWLVRGAEVLQPLQPYIVVLTFITALSALINILAMLRKLAVGQRRVDIVAENIASGESKLVVSLPAAKVTRAEVLGTLRLAAGGRTLDTGNTSLLRQDFYALGHEVVVELPPEDFQHVQGRARGPEPRRHAPTR